MSAAGQTATATGEQFYVTHCVTADSVLDAPGYSVRAASVSAADQNALRAALEYPPYELPIDMWKDKPQKNNTPRRLARTKHPRAGVWVAHSVYLEKDTMGRDRSYFTHLLQLPASVGLASILESWDAPGWAKEYALGAPKTLPKGKLPTGTAVSAKAVTGFLAGTQTGPADLGVAVCPVRLRGSIETRRELVAKFLHAVTLVGRANEDRDRLFVHAEPGLVALLLYAAARILPPVFTNDLTFSTFEPNHRNIRDYKAATVVGTYLGVPGKALDPDLCNSRGYGLDTFVPERSSAELNGRLPVGIAELLELAATGQWDLLGDVHKVIGRGDDVLSRVGQAVARAQALGRLEAGNPTVDDLLALHETSGDAGIPPARAEKMWPFVRGAALTDPRVRAVFKDWLADTNRLTEYRREAAEMIARGDLAGWDARWTVIREAASFEQKQHQLDRALKSLDKYLPQLTLPARARLRTACQESGISPNIELHHLFTPTGMEELELILTPGAPADWQGYACFAVMGPDANNWLLETTLAARPAMRNRVRRFLYGAPVEALSEYARHARPYLDTDSTFLADLFRPYSDKCRPLMDRLLRTNALEPGDWVKLIEAVNLYAGDWDGFLLEGDRLSLLLIALGGDGIGASVWKGYLDELSPVLLSPVLADPGVDGATVHAWERKVHGQLQVAADRLSKAEVKLVNALPPGGVAKLFAATELLRWIENPELGDKLSVGDANDVCKKFGVPTIDMLRAAFVQGNFPNVDVDTDARSLAPFITLFRACYPTDLNFRSSSNAVTQWLNLSEHCPDETRAAFQAYLVTEYVPRELHRDILEEPRQIGFLPEADARVREAMAVPERKPGGEKYRPKARGGSRPRSSLSDDDAAYASPATKRAKRAGKKGQGGCLGVLLLVGFVAAGVIIGLV